MVNNSAADCSISPKFGKIGTEFDHVTRSVTNVQSRGQKSNLQRDVTPVTMCWVIKNITADFHFHSHLVQSLMTAQ